MVVISTAIMVVLKYPASFWIEVAPVTGFTILALVGHAIVVEMLIATCEVVTYLAMIALRSFPWLLLGGWVLYVQVKIGHREILIVLLGAGVLYLVSYRIEKIAHKELW